MNGEAAPHSYLVKLHSLYDGALLFNAYSDRDPRRAFKMRALSHGYMKYLDGPDGMLEGGFLQVPLMSSSTHVVLMTREYIQDYIEDTINPKSVRFPKWMARHTLDEGLEIMRWSQYRKMKFRGSGFRVTKWDDWL